jgi:hypothetical protein
MSFESGGSSGNHMDKQLFVARIFFVCHSGLDPESGDFKALLSADKTTRHWIPAFAGMTDFSRNVLNGV